MKAIQLRVPFYQAIIGDGAIDLDQVQKYISENAKDEKVAEFLNTVRPIDENVVSDFLQKDESGKKLATTLFDKRVNEAVLNHDKKFTTEKLPTILEEEREKLRKELNPEETPEQKENRLLKERIENLEKKENYNALKNTALDLLTETKLPFQKIVDNFIGKDEETTVNNIQAFKDIWDATVSEAVTKKIAESNGRELNDGHGNKKDRKSLEIQLDEAKKAGNLAEVVRLKNVLSAKGLEEARNNL